MTGLPGYDAPSLLEEFIGNVHSEDWNKDWSNSFFYALL